MFELSVIIFFICVLIFLSYKWARELIAFCKKGKKPPFKFHETKLSRNLNALILLCAVLTLPLFYIGILFGLVGSNSLHYVIIAIGFIGIFICGITGFFKEKFRYGTFICIGAIVVGLTLDTLFWSNHNSELCSSLKIDPNCVEEKHGFSCGAGGFYPSSMCNK